jgi:uncharacterized protein YndB with AHSA1/START domain
MTATDQGTPALVVRRQIPVPRERVFQAWLDSESLAQWMRPGDSTHATVTVDPRVGGGFRIVMDGGSHGCVEHTGEYLSIEPPTRLSFTWISKHTDQRPTVVTIEFHEREGGTELVLTHRGLPPREVVGHRQGWTDIVRLLEAVVSRQ